MAADDLDLGERYRPAGRRLAHELAGAGPFPPHAGRYPLADGEDLLDRGVQVGEGGPDVLVNLLEPGRARVCEACDGRQLDVGRQQFVDDVEAPGADAVGEPTVERDALRLYILSSRR